MKRSERSSRGQSTVEFALVLPVVLLLVVGLVQIARVVAMQVAVVDAARVEARAASVDPDAVDRHDADAEVTVVFGDGPPPMVTVRVTRTVTLLPGLGWASVELHASSTMSVESEG